MIKILATILMSAAFVATLSSNANADHPSLYIITPSHGEVVSNPVRVRFGLRGMGVAPAGVDRDKTGHHHLLIDVKTLPALDKPIPLDINHRHFGGGQTEVELELSPGTHTLQLLLGDKYHAPHSDALLSEKITITVENDSAN
jgi:hypothetical protein